jgi:hypothetical protein
MGTPAARVMNMPKPMKPALPATSAMTPSHGTAPIKADPIRIHGQVQADQADKRKRDVSGDGLVFGEHACLAETKASEREHRHPRTGQPRPWPGAVGRESAGHVERSDNKECRVQEAVQWRAESGPQAVLPRSLMRFVARLYGLAEAACATA